MRCWSWRLCLSCAIECSAAATPKCRQDLPLCSWWPARGRLWDCEAGTCIPSVGVFGTSWEPTRAYLFLRRDVDYRPGGGAGSWPCVWPATTEWAARMPAPSTCGPRFRSIVGARLLYVITQFQEFSNPVDIVMLNKGGWPAYGGMLGGFLASWVWLPPRRSRFCAGLMPPRRRWCWARPSRAWAACSSAATTARCRTRPGPSVSPRTRLPEGFYAYRHARAGPGLGVVAACPSHAD